MGNVKEDTFKGSKWAAVEKISSLGIQFIISIILARLLSPSDFGVVGMLAIFIAVSQTFVDSGFSNALIRKIDRSDVDFSTAFYFNVVVGIGCFGLMWLMSPWVALFFNTPILADLLKVLALVIFFNSLAVVQIAKLTIDINFKAQALATVFSVVISGCVGISMAYCGYGVWSLVWQQVTAAVIKTSIIWLQIRWLPCSGFSYKSFRELFSFGSKLLASGLLGAIYSQLTSILIGKFYLPKDLGLYTRGQQFAQLPTSTITGILARVTFPILSNLQNDDDRLLQIYRKYIRITSMIIFFPLMLLAALAHPLVLILIGEKWEGCVILLQILCLGYMTDHISILNLQLLQVKGRSDLYLNLEIIKRIISFAFIICAVRYGVIAICIAIVVYSYLGLYVNTYYIGKIFNFGIKKQIREVFGYYFCAFLACIPASLIVFIPICELFQIFAGTVVAFSIYYALLRSDAVMQEIVHIIKERN